MDFRSNKKLEIAYKGRRTLIFAFWRSLTYQKVWRAGEKPQDEHEETKPCLHRECFVMNYFSSSSFGLF